MILLLAALAAATPAAAPAAAASCPNVVTPEALVCRALDAQKHGDLQGSARAFEQAALASPGKESANGRLWAAAGNMWIAANGPAQAAADLDKALAASGLTGQQRGEVLLDRARAAEAQDDLKTARAKLDEAAATISDDPFTWYFSAALAIREKDLAAAQAAIAKALALAPSDPVILFEAGHVADLAGDVDKARSYWMRAAGSDPNGDVGKAAAKAVEMLGVTPTVKLEPAEPR